MPSPESDGSVAAGARPAGSITGSSAIVLLIRIAENPRNRLCRAVHDSDSPRVAHARWSDNPHRSDARPIIIRRGDEAERAQVRIQVLAADDHGEPRSVDVFVQQTNQLLLLLDHPQER